VNATLRMILGRIGGLLVTLFLSSIVIYSALLLTPGDPVAALAGGARPNPELIAQIRAEHHLDDSIVERYLQWLSGIFTGDLGRSFVYKTDVVNLIVPRLGVTLQLVLLTVVFIIAAGIGSGILAAVRGSGTDRAVGILTAIGMALPTFVVAILLIWIFAKTLGWFPVYGNGSGGLDRVWHLILPAVSLAVMYIAYVSRVTRSSMVQQLNSEHVETARVRGIPFTRILTVHVFRNASPQILAISGSVIASLFAISAIAEQAFGLSGLGSLLTEAAAREDLPVVQIVSLLLVTIFVVLNAAADLISAAIDPTSVAGRSSS
jgi:peptide/nickel transport system permease protein